MAQGAPDRSDRLVGSRANGGPSGSPTVTATDPSGSEGATKMKNEEVFQIEELEARLEMQPLLSTTSSSCTSKCGGDDLPPESYDGI
jgi:hypothetical protein